MRMNLADYLRSHEVSAASFGSRIGIENRATIWRYIKGKRFPTPSILARIHEATDGKVTASDFIEQHRASNPEMYSKNAPVWSEKMIKGHKRDVKL